MKQVVIIHGGDSYSSHSAYLSALKSMQLDYDQLKPKRRWRDYLVNNLTDADILLPTMPNSSNAQYDEWKIYFEKLLPFFGNNVRLVGHSLGAMFLTKYLHGNPLTSPLRQLVLLAGGYDDPEIDYGSFAVESATNLTLSCHEVHLMHSRDDFVVPFTELAKYQADLPDAKVHEFANRNHFLDESFPELLEILRQK